MCSVAPWSAGMCMFVGPGRIAPLRAVAAGTCEEGAIYDVGGCALTDLSGALSLVFDCAG